MIALTVMPTRWLVAMAVAAVLLAVGLYGVRAGWFGGRDADDFTPPKLGQAPPERKVDTHEDAIARSGWGAPAGAPLVGVGAAVSTDAPTQATLPVADGRANVGIRVPRAKANGTPYNGYSLEVRSGTQHLWGSFVPVGAAKGENEAIALSLNANLLHAIGADQEPITVVVGGTAPRKGDTLGMVHLTLQQTP